MPLEFTESYLVAFFLFGLFRKKMIPYYNSQQSQDIDKFAIEQQGTPGILLMKRAAFFALETLHNIWLNAKHIHIICGTGKNAGDGYLLGQLAYLAGYEVSLSQIGFTHKIKGDTLTALHELVDVGLNPYPLTAKSLNQADVLVDAVFGTGLNRPVTDTLAEQFNLINQANKPVLALDIPSGLDANTGNVLGTAIKANHTCTFITRKIGLVSYLGEETAGKVHFSDLFIDSKSLNSQKPLAHNHSLKYWLNKIPQKTASTHKGLNGTAYLIGGNKNMMGAIQLAGTACLKTGAGLVKITSLEEHNLLLTQSQPEFMTYCLEQLPQQLKGASCLAIGPGLGQDQWAKQSFKQAIATRVNKVMDADALNLLSKQPEPPEQQANWILTPHPKEAARLLNTTTEEIQSNRPQAVQDLQKQYGGIIALKGNGTLVFDGKKMEVCTAGNAGMAVGGMGDVLTGTILSLLAQGLSLFDAACLGVSLHAHAGDALANKQNQASVIPSDIILTINQLLSYKT